MAIRQASATISAQNNFAGPIEFENRPFNVSVIGTAFTGTVTLQRSFDGGTTWGTVAEYTTTGS